MRRAEIFAAERGTVEIHIEVRWARAQLRKEGTVNVPCYCGTVISIRHQERYVVVLLEHPRFDSASAAVRLTSMCRT